MHVDLDKIQVIQYWLALTTFIELHRIFDLANLYKRLALNFSHIRQPLHEVTKGRVKEECVSFETQQNELVELKQHLFL